VSATITRSTGTPIPGSGLVAGGGYRGLTGELDAAVCEAARALVRAYGTDVEIRYNSDRESGGAWLVTPDGRNDRVGICASLVTARARATWERLAEQDENMASTGICSWGGKARPAQRKAARACAAEWRATLRDNPEGQLTVLAHIDYTAAGPELGRTLALLPGWNGPAGRMTGYHHGAAESVGTALARCLAFVPSELLARDAEDLARWEADGGA
jgi:hypothetical protein